MINCHSPPVLVRLVPRLQSISSQVGEDFSAEPLCVVAPFMRSVCKTIVIVTIFCYYFCMSNLAKDEDINLKEYSALIETVSKVEFSKVSSYGLIEYPEILNLATHTVYLVLKNGSDNLYNNAYLTKAIKWEIRNEIRRRYRWYSMKNTIHTTTATNDDVREVVYKAIVSVEAMAEAENPVVVKDSKMTPSENAEYDELKSRIKVAISHLPERERNLVEAKFYQDKKLKEISDEFNISQSRISRIIQNALKKVRKELMKQGI